MDKMARVLKLTVGQKVAVKIEDNSNASRYTDMSLENIDNWCFEGEVIKVGRKYTSGGADYKLYLSREEVIEEKEANEIYRQIKHEFDGYKNDKYTLDQLKRIKSIVEEE